MAKPLPIYSGDPKWDQLVKEYPFIEKHFNAPARQALYLSIPLVGYAAVARFVAGLREGADYGSGTEGAEEALCRTFYFKAIGKVLHPGGGVLAPEGPTFNLGHAKTVSEWQRNLTVGLDHAGVELDLADLATRNARVGRGKAIPEAFAQVDPLLFELRYRDGGIIPAFSDEVTVFPPDPTPLLGFTAQSWLDEELKKVASTRGPSGDGNATTGPGGGQAAPTK